MAEQLQAAIGAMSLRDDELIDLPDSPRFKVFEQNTLNLLGHLLNPSCLPMEEMIETMPRVWRVYSRVRGIALSSEKFQFIFEREEDMETVLKVDVWIRISKIPVNYYKVETMHFLASKVGHVIEITYDPKVSQKVSYIIAHVRLDIANPAMDHILLNLPSWGLTLLSVAESESYGKSEAGFPPLFAVLSVDTRKAALQYISHSDETERRARIMRVEQSILEGSEDHNPKMPKITHDLNKGKGHVFDFADHQQQDAILSRNERSGTKSSPVCGKELEDEASDSGGVEVSSNFPVLSSTVFRIGASSVAHLAGTQSEGKKSRKRPNKWRRMAHAKSVELASKDVGSAELCATDSEQNLRNIF
ncbi:hypothetical protein Bca101_059164 [Brassica carinata]